MLLENVGTGPRRLVAQVEFLAHDVVPLPGAFDTLYKAGCYALIACPHLNIGDANETIQSVSLVGREVKAMLKAYHQPQRITIPLILPRPECAGGSAPAFIESCLSQLKVGWIGGAAKAEGVHDPNIPLPLRTWSFLECLGLELDGGWRSRRIWVIGSHVAGVNRRIMEHTIARA